MTAIVIVNITLDKGLSILPYIQFTSILLLLLIDQMSTDQKTDNIGHAGLVEQTKITSY